MRRYDVWIMTLLIIIVISCIRLEKPQMIDCTKPIELPKETPPPKIETNHYKDELDSCEEEIKRLRWEGDLYLQQRDEYLEQLRKCTDHHYEELPLDEETV